MIISKEQKDYIDEFGNQRKSLIISYVNKQGGISFMTYKIPQEDMFIWKYSGKKNADPVWRSYDNKLVRKVPCKTLDEHRINEILCSFGNKVDPLFELNIPDTWFCDIETDVSSDGFSKPEDAFCRINTIAITKWPKTIVFGLKPLDEENVKSIQTKIDNYAPRIIKDYEFEYKYFDDEVHMLYAFIEFIRDIAALTGWNFIGFDWNYIINRCKRLNIPYHEISPTKSFAPFKLNNKAGTVYTSIPMHKIIYDYLLVYKTWDMSIYPKENNTLDFVAEKALGIKKVQHNLGFKEFYEQDYENYVFYNAIDTILVEQIDKKIKTSNIWYGLASELRTDLNMSFSTIKPTEVVMGNFIYAEHKVMPHKDYDKGSVQSSYEGAFVWPSQPGVYHMIGGLDYSSLYPTIIRQFGISPEMFMFKDTTGTYKPKDDEIKTSSGSVFKKSKDAILPRILTYYFAKRKSIKNQMKETNVELEYLKNIYEKRLKAMK